MRFYSESPSVDASEPKSLSVLFVVILRGEGRSGKVGVTKCRVP
jgi:hypothetical protein